MCFLYEIPLFALVSILLIASIFLSSDRKSKSRSSFICLSLPSSETLVVEKAVSSVSLNSKLVSFISASSGENKQVSISSEISSKRNYPTYILTGRYHLRVKFPNLFNTIHSSKRWLNVLHYLYLKFTFAEQKQKEFNLNQEAKAHLFDVFKGQITPAVTDTDLLHKYICIAIHVPNNHKNIFQLFYIC